ncbi:MAG: hypothetical protein QXJ59_10855 [Thermofilaceae archaeon]
MIPLKRFFLTLFEGGEVCRGVEITEDGSVLSNCVREHSWFYGNWLAAEYRHPHLILYKPPFITTDYVKNLHMLLYVWRKWWYETERRDAIILRPHLAYGRLLLGEEDWDPEGRWGLSTRIKFYEFGDNPYIIVTRWDLLNSEELFLEAVHHPDTKPHVLIPHFGSLIIPDRYTLLSLRKRKYLVKTMHLYFKPWGEKIPYYRASMRMLSLHAENVISRLKGGKTRKIVEFIRDASDLNSLLSFFELAGMVDVDVCV